MMNGLLLRGSYGSTQLEGRGYGRYPVLEEVLDYYLRDDVSKVLFDLTRTRRTFFKWRLQEKGKTHSEEVITGTIDQFRTFIEGSLNRLPTEAQFNRYPHFEARAARYQKKQRGSEFFGYDFLFESDGLSLRDNFSKLDLALGILEGYGVPYLAKFSGNTSLHIIIPAEVFPEMIKGESVVANWPLIDSAIASYLRVFGKTEIDHEPTGTLPYSLSRKTGLISMPLQRRELEDFEPWMANLHLIEKVKMPTAMDPDAVGNSVKSTGGFLEDVLAWHEPRMLLGEHVKRKAWGTSSRLLRQMRAGVNSEPLEFWMDLLGSQRRQDRVRGAWGLLWHKDREKASSKIVERLKDPCPDVRYFLIVLMAKIGPERFPRRIKEALASSVRDGHEMMAIEDLLVLDRKDGLRITLSILSKKLNRWGVQMEVSVLRRMKLPRNIFYGLLSSDDAGIRIATAIAVGKLRDTSSIGFLEDMLDDPSREVRLAVISSLGLIGEASSIKVLSLMLERQPIIVRRKAIQALSRINDPEALRIICGKALKGDVDTKMEAVRVLDGRPGEMVQDILLAALKDKHPRVRLTSLRLLLHRGRETAIRAMEEALQTEDEVIKRETESLRNKYGVEHFPLAWSLDNI